MKNWLTTHYKHHHDDHPYHIFLKEAYKQKSEAIDVGDRVVFYELQGKGNGRQRVICIARVSGRIRQNTHQDGGPDIGDQRWEWEIPCDEHDSNGHLSKRELYGILEWPENKPMQMRGGIIGLEEERFEKIAAAFRANRAST